MGNASQTEEVVALELLRHIAQGSGWATTGPTGATCFYSRPEITEDWVLGTYKRCLAAVRHRELPIAKFDPDSIA